MEFVFVLALDGGPLLRRVLRDTATDMSALRLNVLDKETPARGVWRPVAICGPLTAVRATSLEERLRVDTSNPLRTMRAFAQPGEDIYHREGWSKEQELAHVRAGGSVYEQLLLF
jgi:hypothetical protein